MKKLKRQIFRKGALFGLILIIPHMPIFSDYVAKRNEGRETYANQLIAEAAPPTQSKPAEKAEVEGQLSDTSKIAIAVAVMLFFLGVAITVQIRGQRRL